MTGAIPEELGNLASLVILELDNNQLTGEIPEELGNLARLLYLYLGNNQLTGAIPEELGNLNQLFVARFAGNALTGCVPNGLRRLMTALDRDDLPAQDFIAVDANGDGDTSDDGDTPGLGLPFCTLRSLTLSGVTLAPAFASDTVAYTASATLDVLSTSVTATLYNFADTISITKGADTYMSGDPVPLNVGENVIHHQSHPCGQHPCAHLRGDDQRHHHHHRYRHRHRHCHRHNLIGEQGRRRPQPRYSYANPNTEPNAYGDTYPYRTAVLRPDCR